MLDDLLDTVTAALAMHDANDCDCGWEDFCFEYFDGHDDDRAYVIRALVASCEQAEADLAEERQEHQATLQMAAEERERHAEVVEKAYREGYDDGMVKALGCESAFVGYIDEGWLASDARKAVARDNG